MKDNGSASNLNSVAARRSESEGQSQVPEFHMSVPDSFRISQPNFYTEVNASASTPPTSNFAHTANIDEDYDT